MKVALVLFLCFLYACSGDVMPPKEKLPDLALLKDKQWNLKTSIKSGVTATHQGEWVRFSVVETPAYCGWVWEDSFGNKSSIVMSGMTFFNGVDDYWIDHLKSDSLVLRTQGGNSYRFSVR